MSLTILRATNESLTFDSVTREEFSPSVNVTAHPVESGSPISDHAQANPLQLSAQCLITESPLGEVGGGFAAIEHALEFLKAIEGELVTVVSTKLGSFSSMMITSYAHSITAAGNLPVDLRAVEVRTAISTTVRIPATQPVAAHQSSAPDELDAGQQTGDDIDQSMLASLYDYAGF